jgi:O-glycosyl hydrolase
MVPHREKFLPAALLAMLPFCAAAQTAPAPIQIAVDPQSRFQIMDGFGVNFNGTYFREAQKPMIDMLVKDLGATIFRLDPYGTSDWEVKNDDPDPAHMNWEYYNDRYSTGYFEPSWGAARYLNSLGIRPFLTLSGITPDWMNDAVSRPVNHKVCRSPEQVAKDGQTRPYHLDPKKYDEFAELVVSMLVYARQKAHVDFEYFSPLNETDCFPVEGPRVDPDEMPAVLRAVVRRLRAEHLDNVRLVAADQSSSANDYIGPILADDEVMKSVAVLSLHSYGAGAGVVAPHLETIARGKHPETRVWLTEYGDLGAADRSFESEWKLQSLAATRRALRAINEGARAALFWDAFDNLHEHDRAMTYYGLIRNDDHQYSPKKRYYAAKQLYRFVPPGARRIGASSDSTALVASAFRDGESGKLIVVGVKEGGSRQVLVSVPVPAPRSWDLYVTSRDWDCVKADSFRAPSGVLRIDLPDEAVFTLVSAGGEEK